ncbi:MAG TPA: bifunctional UDP-sugar hydrolase/5'-nucleotidase [Patescibacteria group bacterium]|nr:bifunctional UDP-sugar hydrolase/5'-nucleotidase [Patescibacteria group bacterium]
MKRLTACWLQAMFCLALLLAVPQLAVQAQDKPQTFQLTIIHTNDFHDHEPYALARKATLIKKIREQNANVLLLDAGDLYTRGPYHKVFYGELEMAAMNAMRYDAWELGNNEFKGETELAVADEKLYRLIDQSQFPVLCSNIKTDTGEYLAGVRPYTVKRVGGVNVGILGVSSLKVKKYPQGANKRVEDPVDTARELLPQLQAESDIQIILSHAGLSEDVKMDMKLAEKGISLIIGADDHYVIERPIWRAGGVPIVQAGGEENIYLGQIDLTFEKRNGKWVLVSQQGKLYHIDETIPMDAGIKAIIDRYLATVKKAA